MNEEDEQIMLDAAVRESLQTANTNVASSSSNRIAGPSREAQLRAAAAEQRLTRKNKAVDVDDYEEAHMDSDALDIDSSDEEPLLSPTRGKGKASPKTKSVSIARPPKVMTVAEMRRARKEARLASITGRKANKKEEMALMKKLGRRLTHVSGLQVCSELRFSFCLFKRRNEHLSLCDGTIPNCETFGETYRRISLSSSQLKQSNQITSS